MEFYVEPASGYLLKSSGISWSDCLLQEPVPLVGEGLRVGKRYFVGPRPYQRNWHLDRAFLSFETSLIGTRPYKSARLVLPVAVRGAGLVDSLALYGAGTAPWGESLEADDWGKCNRLLTTLAAAKLSGIVEIPLPFDTINRYGCTQFALRLTEEVTEPVGEDYIEIAGADAGQNGATLVVEGNPNDDVCIKQAQILSARMADLGVNAVRSELHHTIDQAPEIQIGWSGTHTDLTAGEQQISTEIYYIEEEAPGEGVVPVTLDGDVRRKADLIRRILTEDYTCLGYCSGLIDISEELADALMWANGSWYRGALIKTTYKRPVSPGDPV